MKLAIIGAGAVGLIAVSCASVHKHRTLEKIDIDSSWHKKTDLNKISLKDSSRLALEHTEANSKTSIEFDSDFDPLIKYDPTKASEDYNINPQDRTRVNASDFSTVFFPDGTSVTGPIKKITHQEQKKIEKKDSTGVSTMDSTNVSDSSGGNLVKDVVVSDNQVDRSGGSWSWLWLILIIAIAIFLLYKHGKKLFNNSSP